MQPHIRSRPRSLIRRPRYPDEVCSANSSEVREELSNAKEVSYPLLTSASTNLYSCSKMYTAGGSLKRARKEN